MDKDYDGKGSVEGHGTVAQCAGAAIFRANVDRAKLMPSQLHSLPADTEKVYETPAELLAAFKDCTVEAAETTLALVPPVLLMQMEMEKAHVKALPKGAPLT